MRAAACPSCGGRPRSATTSSGRGPTSRSSSPRRLNDASRARARGASPSRRGRSIVPAAVDARALASVELDVGLVHGLRAEHDETEPVGAGREHEVADRRRASGVDAVDEHARGGNREHAEPAGCGRGGRGLDLGWRCREDEAGAGRARRARAAALAGAGDGSEGATVRGRLGGRRRTGAVDAAVGVAMARCVAGGASTTRVSIAMARRAPHTGAVTMTRQASPGAAQRAMRRCPVLARSLCRTGGGSAVGGGLARTSSPGVAESSASLPRAGAPVACCRRSPASVSVIGSSLIVSVHAARTSSATKPKKMARETSSRGRLAIRWAASRQRSTERGPRTQSNVRSQAMGTA